MQELSLSADRAFALLASGALQCWGDDRDDVLETHRAKPATEPVPVRLERGR